MKINNITSASNAFTIRTNTANVSRSHATSPSFSGDDIKDVFTKKRELTPEKILNNALDMDSMSDEDKQKLEKATKQTDRNTEITITASLSKGFQSYLTEMHNKIIKDIGQNHNEALNSILQPERKMTVVWDSSLKSIKHISIQADNQEHKPLSVGLKPFSDSCEFIFTDKNKVNTTVTIDRFGSVKSILYQRKHNKGLLATYDRFGMIEYDKKPFKAPRGTWGTSPFRLSEEEAGKLLLLVLSGN